MRDFLLASCPIAIWCITALELILTVLMISPAHTRDFSRE